MARIIGIDWGGKRTGIAVTDPLQIISSPLETVETVNLLDFLKAYCAEESVETIVMGEPRHMDGTDAESTGKVHEWVEKLKIQFPDIEIVLQDERLSSKSALQIVRNSGLKKKDQKDKKRLDRISAAIILDNYLDKKRRF